MCLVGEEHTPLCECENRCELLLCLWKQSPSRLVILVFFHLNFPLLCVPRQRRRQGVCAQLCSPLCTLWTVAHQAPLSMGFWARILEWVAMLSSRGPNPTQSIKPGSPVSPHWQILYHWASWEAPKTHFLLCNSDLVYSCLKKKKKPHYCRVLMWLPYWNLLMNSYYKLWSVIMSGSFRFTSLL